MNNCCQAAVQKERGGYDQTVKSFQKLQQRWHDIRIERDTLKQRVAWLESLRKNAAQKERERIKEMLAARIEYDVTTLERDVVRWSDIEEALTTEEHDETKTGTKP